MEGNRDEAEKCLQIARRALQEGQTDKALKFLHKAEKLYPSVEAKALIDAITTNGSAAGARHRSESGKPYQRKSASSGTENGTTSEKESKVDSTKVYTKEQLEGVQRIKRCKDYYEILGTSKDASDEDLKKAYRKLALKFHPDKNHAPGATEAFKAIGNAYALLSNPAKRKDYDQYGDSQSPGNYQHGGFEFHRNYESDITPEDLFNMFFGGGFPSGNTQPYSNGRARASHQSSHRGEREEERADGGFSTFIQLMPIIVLVLVSVLSQLMVTTPPYSLYYRAAMEHTVRKQTSNLKVVYYVNKDFDKEYTGVTLQKVEKSVEEDYINNLRNNCWRERQEKNDYLYASKVYRDDRLRKKAELMRMESCEKLARLNDLYRGG